MSARKTIVLTGCGLLLVVGYLSLYTVKQGQQALLLRLGQMVSDRTGVPVVIDPGLHFKIPLLNQIRKFDVRLQTLDVQSSRVLTEEQKYLLVDYYVKWRIADLPLYFTRTGGFNDKAEVLLQQKINDALRAAFGKRSITEVVSGERGSVMEMLLQRADEGAQSLGIKVVDVRIKRIDLPEEVSSSVFERMRVEREQAATKHRADGKAAAEAVKAQADAKVTVTLAEAKAKAAQTRADGVRAAAKIYAAAYSKNLKFYYLYRSLEAYKNAFSNKNDVLVLTPDSQFFKYFNSSNGS